MTNAEWLRPRPLLLGLALTGLVLLVAGAVGSGARRWGRPVDWTPRAVSVTPSLRRAVLRFESRDAFAPIVEYGSAAAGPFTTSGPEATAHEIALERLTPGTDYEYRIFNRERESSLARRFTTLTLAVQDLSLSRQPDRVELTFKTNLPARALLNYWPAGEEREGAVQTRDADSPPGLAHHVVATQLDPERGYALALAFVTPDGDTAEWPQLAAPSAREILDELAASVKRASSSKLIARVINAQRELERRWPLKGARVGPMVPLRTARLREMLGADFDELARAAARFRPMAKLLFASDRVYLAEKMRLYEFLSMADELQSFCQNQAIAIDLGLAGIDRGPFRLGLKSHFAGEKLSPAVPPHVKMAPEQDGILLDPAMADRAGTHTSTIAVKNAAGIARAQVVVSMSLFRSTAKLAVTLNGASRLSMILPPDSPDLMRDVVFHHEIDPGLLVEGDNKIEVALESVVGCVCIDSPRLDGVDLIVRRKP